MDNMIPLTQTTVKSRKADRSQEVIQGWARYNKLACKIAFRWYATWFPTTEDVEQAAALAATEGFSKFGEEANYIMLCRLIHRVMYSQAAAYGRRHIWVTKPNGKKGTARLNPEVSYTHLADRTSHQEKDDRNLGEYLESRMMVVGVGEYTRYHAHFLYDLLH